MPHSTDAAMLSRPASPSNSRLGSFSATKSPRSSRFLRHALVSAAAGLAMLGTVLGPSAAPALASTAPKLPTGTSVTCSPNPTVYPSTTTCTALVIGDYSGGGIKGSVLWGTGNSGHFSSSTCTLTQLLSEWGPGYPVRSQCAVQYTPGAGDAGRNVVIAAVYSGNALYTGSEGKTTLQVTKGS